MAARQQCIADRAVSGEVFVAKVHLRLAQTVTISSINPTGTSLRQISSAI
jgi:hypothetical protein